MDSRKEVKSTYDNVGMKPTLLKQWKTKSGGEMR
jgi:hypothetical protein